MKPEILLLYPGSDPSNPHEEISSDPGRSMPMGILFLAAALERGGYGVTILDARTMSKSEDLKWLKDSLEHDPVYVGISAMTVQIGHALDLARAVRSHKPDIPIVWGGAHPSLYPDSTCQDTLVDYVLRNEADFSAVKLADALREHESVESVPGITYQSDDTIHSGPIGTLPDITALESPAYHLLDTDMYLERTLADGRRVLGVDILTSRGCPYRCAFCPNEILLGRRWRKRPVDQVLDELDLLLSDSRINHVWFMDDLFIGDRDRVVRIVEYLHRKYPAVLWEANVRADMFREGLVDESFLKFLKKTGCSSLRMGAESGNDEILRLLKKDITVEQTIHAVAACNDAGIVPVCFFMMGIPGERIDQIYDTLALMADLKIRFPHTMVCGPGLFRPYPGGELYASALEMGLSEPRDLAQWAEALGIQGFLKSNAFPWIENTGLLDDLLFYMFHIEQRHNLSSFSLPALRRFISDIALWRARHKQWKGRIFAASKRHLSRFAGAA